MDPLLRKILKDLEEMRQQPGRLLRNMAVTGMRGFDAPGQRVPSVDVYESELKYFLYFDIAGADSGTVSVVVDGQTVRVQGVRRLPEQDSIACIHQLEIETGRFDRTVTVPGPVDVEGVVSRYVDGILTVVLPKRQSRPRMNIQVSTGGGR